MDENTNSNASLRQRLKKRLEKPLNVCRLIFGYGIMISLFVGGLTLFGYLAAMVIGGDTAVQICAFIKDYIIKWITYLSTVMVLLGLVIMYLSGEVALSAKKSKPKSNDQQNSK